MNVFQRRTIAGSARCCVSAAAVLAVALVAANAASAASSLTLRLTAPPHFFGAYGACPSGHVADTVTATDGARLGALDGCFQTFTFFADGSDAFTATYTFDLRGGRVVTSVSGTETPTATGIVMAVSGSIIGGTGRYAGVSGTINGGGPVDFTADPIQPDLTFNLAFA